MAGGKSAAQEVKTVQIGFRTEAHDMGVRASQADKFLKKGHRVKVEMKLRGREKVWSVGTRQARTVYQNHKRTV